MAAQPGTGLSTLPIGTFLRAAAALGTAVLLTSCSAPPVPLVVGVHADTVADRDAFAGALGVPVGLYGWFSAWEGRPDFDAARASAATASGSVPMLTWEPWDPGAGVDQPRYALDRIVQGEHDDYIRSYAVQVRDWGGPLALRFAHELNAPFYPWSVGVNGNRTRDAVAAWRHVRRLFQDEGADVTWVWSVNVSGADTVPYEDLFPGDDQVDWLALDGYNGGSALPWGGWRSPEELFGDDVEALHELGDHPVVLTEVGSAEAGGDKAAWVRSLFAFAREQRVSGLVWFDYRKEADWRVSSSPETLAAFRSRAGAADLAAQPPLPDRLGE